LDYPRTIESDDYFVYYHSLIPEDVKMKKMDKKVNFNSSLYQYRNNKDINRKVWSSFPIILCSSTWFIIHRS